MGAQHYAFAHREIPGVVFANPTAFLSVMARGEGDGFIRFLWDSAARSSGIPGEPATDIAVHVYRRPDGRILAVIDCPPPQESPEAHFVAVADVTEPGSEGVAVRVFTLEASVDVMTNKPMTMLCEWTAQGIHANLGAGPPPDRQEFVSAIGRVADLTFH